MDSNRWRQVDSLLQSVLQRQPEERTAFLRQACVGDEVLEHEVLSLLSSQQQAASFLESPAIEVAAFALSRQLNKNAQESGHSLIGRTISHYRIIEKLGGGGMGVVYKARDLRLDRFAAIKVLPTELLCDQTWKQRFIQEAKSASSLNHPNIITIHEIDQAGGTDFMVTEFVDGETIEQLIPRNGMPVSEVLKLTIPMASALAAAHAAGIIHRDIKPGNVMVSRSGVVKVLDFGLAKLIGPDKGEADNTHTRKAQTEEGTILGTAGYMSPEQAQGKTVDTRSDIFSLGVVLYEMLSGQRPFKGANRMSTLASILQEEPKPLSEVDSRIPREVEKAVLRCLRKDPERRFQHMIDLKVVLEDLNEESDSGKLGTVGPTAWAAIQSKRARPIIWMAAAFAITALAVVAVWLSRSFPKTPEAPLTTALLTSYPGREDHPSFSPDGNQIAFDWNGEKQDNFDIYVKIVGAGEPLRLTTEPAREVFPAWSPDGKWIAYEKFVESERFSVMVRPPLPGPARKLVDARVLPWTNECSGLAWSPDGKWLVYPDCGQADDPGGLFAVSLETGEKRRLTDPKWPTVDYDPSFSLDGKTLVFVRSSAGIGTTVYQVPISEDLKPGGEPRRLPLADSVYRWPMFLAGDRKILFWSGDSVTGHGSLWEKDVTGRGAARVLASLGDRTWAPSVSRDGRRLAYSSQSLDSDIWRVALSGQGRSGKETTSTPTQFISSTQPDFLPRYSPDGARIAFESDRSGNSEIWTCKSDGVDCSQLTRYGRGASGSPVWSPVGSCIAFDSNISGQWQIYLMPVDGGNARQLTNSPGGGFLPSWSADGNWIYFCSSRTARKEIWRVPAAGGDAMQVTRDGGLMAAESPDGKTLYYIKDDTARKPLWAMSAAGGPDRKMFDDVALRNFVVARDGIYYQEFVENRPSPKIWLRFLSFGTAKSQVLAQLQGPVNLGLSVSPDGKYALYAQDSQSSADLMLVENFH